ncbi:MAG: PqqD family protein [Firmicutes bacterium]|nr:PqqD family protein [Candidatus Colimorpha enterica]
MKLKYDFDSVSIDEEVIAVPVGESSKDISGVLRLNEDASEIFSLLKEDTTEEAIVDTLAAKYDNDRDELARFVHEVVAQLKEKGLIED